jgi:DNA-binding Lrp family transcriptional regulator
MGAQPFVDWPKDPQHLNASYIARQLGKSPEAIKARIEKLERAKHIAGYELFPNLSQLDLQLVQYIFRLPSPAAASLPTRLATVDGVGGMEFLLGSRVGVEIYGRDEAEIARRAKLVGALMGDIHPEASFRYPRLPTHRPLSSLDWRIIQALRHDATRGLDQVAKTLHVSVRTVKRRLDQMWKEGSIDSFALLNVSEMDGTLFCSLLLQFDPNRPIPPLKELLGKFEDRWCYCHTPPAPETRKFVLGLALNSAGDIDRSLDQARAIPGVIAAEATLSTRIIYQQAWLDEAIARLASGTEPVSAKPRPTRKK